MLQTFYTAQDNPHSKGLTNPHVNDAKVKKPRYKFSYPTETPILMDGSSERYLKISWELGSLSIKKSFFWVNLVTLDKFSMFQSFTTQLYFKLHKMATKIGMGVPVGALTGFYSNVPRYPQASNDESQGL